MRYTDRIYGEIHIDDQVIVEIINSKDFQRLRGVDQAGYFDVYYPNTKHSRFEHSVGCYILLQKRGASLEEQIAGLIHDLSHSAFSHTADYVFAEGSGADQNYQDDIFEDFVMSTEIPQLLKKHGFDVDYILDERNFPLQENDLPDICADRIDYSLRGARIYMKVSQENIDYILDNLTVKDGRWVFNAYEPAMMYAKIFKELNETYYIGKETGAMFYRSAQWLLHAVEKGYITKSDIFTTDDEVIKKINSHLLRDLELKKRWKKMNDPKVDIGCKEDDDVCVVTVKSRIIDPLFCNGDHIIRVSEKDDLWGEIVRKNMVPKTYYLKEE